MALDFALSVVQNLVASGTATTVTITLTGTGTLGSTATFTATGAGTPSAAPTLLTGAIPGATTSFTWTTSATGVVTVTASGGLVAVHTILLTVAKPNNVSAQQIIDQALGLLGVRAPGEAVEASQANDCLLRLNMLIDAWRTEDMYAFSSSTFTATVKPGSKSLTIGPSGDIVTPYRPVSLGEGSYYTNSGIDYGLSPLTQEQFNSIAYKSIGSLGPTGIYYSPDLPNGTLYLYPQPAGTVTLTLVGQLDMTEFADLTTQYVLAPGYRQALAYSLAEAMAPDFARPPSPMVSQTAANARKNIRRQNYSTPMAKLRARAGDIWRGWET